MNPSAAIQNTRRWRKTPKGLLTNLYHKMAGRHEVDFSLQDFHQRWMEDRKFIRLFREWQDSGFLKLKKPSIDRINATRPYTMDNCQMMTWSDNRYKQTMEMRRARARTVYQTLGGVVVAIHASVSHAVRATGVAQGNISSVLSGKRKSAGGFGWSYENPELLEK